MTAVIDFVMRWATYNVGSARNRRVFRDLVRLLKTEQPILLGLNEVGDRADILERFTAFVRRRKPVTPHERAKAAAEATGYVLLRDDSQQSSGHVAALVRPDVRVDHWRIIKISDATDVGRRTAGARKDGRAEAKYLLEVALSIAGEKRIAGVIHFVPSAMKRGNTRTRELYAVQVERVADWFHRHQKQAEAADKIGKTPRWPIVLGDGNAALNKPRERKLLRPLEKVAALYAKASHKLRAIDIFATLLRGIVEVLEGYSSDHKPSVFTETGTPAKPEPHANPAHGLH